MTGLMATVSVAQREGMSRTCNGFVGERVGLSRQEALHNGSGLLWRARRFMQLFVGASSCTQRCDGTLRSCAQRGDESWPTLDVSTGVFRCHSRLLDSMQLGGDPILISGLSC